MNRLLLNILDRLLFVAAVLLFMQIPHFIDQYTQRIAGHYEAEQANLAKYQTIADEFFHGDLKLLVQDFRASQRGSVARMGEVIENSLTRTEQLQKALTVLRGDGFIDKLGYLVSTSDGAVARGALQDFQPGMPFSREAILSGISGGALSMLLFAVSIRLPLRLIRGRRRNSVLA
jgi:hypothetical protein